MSCKLIIFDVDNTLVLYEDDLSFFDELLVETLNIHKILLPPREERYNIWGKGREYPAILEKWGIPKDQIVNFWKTFDQIDIQKRTELTKKGRIKPVDDIHKILNTLSMRGFKLAALSNSNQYLANFFLEYFGIAKYFSDIRGLTPEKDPYDCKPEINNLMRQISLLGFENRLSDIIIVGDSFTDILMAKRIGVQGILFDPTTNKQNPYCSELKETDYQRISSLNELLHLKIESNRFGFWDVDESDQPIFRYTANQFINPDCKTFTTYGGSIDHFHQFGNTKWHATAHNGGYVQVMDPSQGILYITYKGTEPDESLGGGICYINLNETEYCDRFSEHTINLERIFAPNYFEKILNLNEIKIINRIIMPSNDSKSIISKIEVINKTANPIHFDLYNYWGVYFYYLKSSMIVTASNRRLFGTTKTLNLLGNFIKYFQKIFRIDTDSNRKRWANKVKYTKFDLPEKSIFGYHISTKYSEKSNSNSKNIPGKEPRIMKKVFLASLGDSFDFKSFDEKPTKRKNKHTLSGGFKIYLDAHASRTYYTVFGYSDFDEMILLIDQYNKMMKDNSLNNLLYYNNDDNKIKLDIKGEGWLKRETIWHSGYVNGTFFYDEVYGLHKLIQGSAYAYLHGLDGSIRDYCLFIPSAIHINPILAKEFLIYIMNLMEPSGFLPYGVHQNGKHFNVAGVHAKCSDLYLFLLWAIAEYVFTTRDFSFLNVEVPFYSVSKNKLKSTVKERIRLCIEYVLSDKVGIGPNNMLKINDGDWSDGVTYLVKNRKQLIKQGESAFNTTFALYVFPFILPILDKYIPELVPKFKNAIELFDIAMDKAWNGKWFYRAYNGFNNPVGNENCFLEHLVWYLISNKIHSDKLPILLKTIQEVLEDPSPIGQLITYPPTTVNPLWPKGWDVNGGVWHAINSLLTWGYCNYNYEQAWKSLIKNSMMNREKNYPNIWYGIWTGPDSYNAYYAQRPGESFFHISTPMCDYPAQNLNLHATYLLSVIRFAGFSADHEGFILNLNTNREFDLETKILNIKRRKNFLEFSYFAPILEDTVSIKLVGIEAIYWNIDESQSEIPYNVIKSNESEKIFQIQINKMSKKLPILKFQKHFENQ